ncbi:MAG: 4-alpha-glucanotransferase [Candidatus Dormibacteraceae bacterium]
MTTPVAADPATWGIDPGYHSISGEWIPTPQATRDSLLQIMAGERLEPEPSSVVVHTVGAPLNRPEWAEIVTEIGDSVTDLSLPLPLGYHRYYGHDNREGQLIIVPSNCYLPTELRGWAWAVQLYALRSSLSWGHGDFADLRRLARWSRDLGATTLLLNPLHSDRSGPPQSRSPYRPSSRLFRNPLYLRIEEVPGADSAGLPLANLARRGEALNSAPEIDRDQVLELKLAALRQIWSAFPPPPEFISWQETSSPRLLEYATFCALSEHLGDSWRSWPNHNRRPSCALHPISDEGWRRQILFHQWLQWLLERQLAAAALELPPLQDLAVGADPEGADSWMFQDCLAEGVSVGAPPDDFSPQGQDWSILAFDPWKLRQQGYVPFIQMLQANLQHSFGLRIDHVMGLFRLYWIPRQARIEEGAYVRYPYSDLLGILALESQRAGAIIVGEDLGTVEEQVRSELAQRQILSYRLAWFEDHPPEEYPAQALAALTTHDLPTLAGVWSQSDPSLQIRERLQRHCQIPAAASVAEAGLAAYHRLARSPSALVAASLEDAVGSHHRPNYPGVDTPTNWSQALPQGLEELINNHSVAELAAQLRR